MGQTQALLGELSAFLMTHPTLPLQSNAHHKHRKSMTALKLVSSQHFPLHTTALCAHAHPCAQCGAQGCCREPSYLASLRQGHSVRT